MSKVRSRHPPYRREVVEQSAVRPSEAWDTKLFLRYVVEALENYLGPEERGPVTIWSYTIVEGWERDPRNSVKNHILKVGKGNIFRFSTDYSFSNEDWPELYTEVMDWVVTINRLDL